MPGCRQRSPPEEAAGAGERGAGRAGCSGASLPGGFLVFVLVECSHPNAMVTNAASKPSACRISLWSSDSRETRLSSALGRVRVEAGAAARGQGSDGSGFGRWLRCFSGSWHLPQRSLRIAAAFFFFFVSFPGSVRAGDSGSLCTAQGRLVTGDRGSYGLRWQNYVRARPGRGSAALLPFHARSP